MARDRGTAADSLPIDSTVHSSTETAGDGTVSVTQGPTNTGGAPIIPRAPIAPLPDDHPQVVAARAAMEQK